MKSARVRSDFTVELPEELRSCLRPGESLDVMVVGERVTYSRRSKEPKRSMRDIIATVRRNPPDHTPTEAEIEDAIHQVRQERCSVPTCSGI